ncbi:MAG: hypothetical protein CME19_02985 [Gemmatimonadetes bacterium]|nr:hypothetical protein [Gemmatimonadota bacterium]|tara:strand:- start:608 stop:1384 length:777 start_codon:yes stop_codon:yes gene_type:complete
MEAIDFWNAYLTWRTDWNVIPSKTTSSKPVYTLNNARMPVDCCCRITEKATGEERSYVLGGNCKTERVGADRDIWTMPNADFVPVFSQEQFMMIKTFERVGTRVQLYPPTLGEQSDRQVGRCADNFASVRIDLPTQEAQVLESNEQIVSAVLDNRHLVARTAYEVARYSVTLEYPIRTINANERDSAYQTDTGPLLIPDLDRDPDDLISGFELAYSAFNTPDWIEFMVRVATPLTDDISVFHYSESRRFDTTNVMVQL